MLNGGSAYRHLSRIPIGFFFRLSLLPFYLLQLLLGKYFELLHLTSLSNCGYMVAFS